MDSGAYGRRLGGFVGVQAPPTVRAQPLRNADFAATRIVWNDLKEGVSARIEPEDAFLVCLERRDVPSHPYWVAGRPVPMSPVRRGQFSLLDLRAEHASYNRDPIDCLAMYVPRRALDAIALECRAPPIGSIHVKPGLAVDDPVVWHLGECLLPALVRSAEANRLFVDHVALALLTHLAATYGGLRPGSLPRLRGGLAPWQERRAKDALMAHLDGDIGLDELARLCSLSRSHFARAFKRTTGTSPHRWLMAQRVERTKDLLLHSSLSIEQIAASCGFADQSHLTRVFTKQVHATPGRWRRSWRS